MINYLRRQFPKWQDWVIAGGNLVFGPALIPMILAPVPPPLVSSITTALVLWAFVTAFWTMQFKLSVALVAFGASMWTALAVQGLVK